MNGLQYEEVIKQHHAAIFPFPFVFVVGPTFTSVLSCPCQVIPYACQFGGEELTRLGGQLGRVRGQPTRLTELRMNGPGGPRRPNLSELASGTLEGVPRYGGLLVLLGNYYLRLYKYNALRRC